MKEKMWSVLSGLTIVERQMKELLCCESIDSVSKGDIQREMVTLRNLRSRLNDVDKWASFVQKEGDKNV